MQTCQAITRKSASNLALAFILLPRQRREAMAALYAFCREVDDVADEDSRPADDRRASLAAWRQDIRLACDGPPPSQPVNIELQPVIWQYGLPFDLFDELIKGCEMDLDTLRHPDYASLELYCYRVASVVGLLSIRVFGHANPGCKEYAIAMGQALQLTNILRDVRTDAARGRIYLPLSELARFGVREEEILRGEYSDRYEALAASVAQKARDYYRKAARLLPPEDRRSMVCAEMMGSVYWRLLRRLERRRFNVFTPQPVRLSKPCKIALILRAWFRSVMGCTTSDYGTP
jgi:phytoene synthase